MVNGFAINTSGTVVLSNEQAKYFALLIFADVKTYIKKHQTEYSQWLTKQKAGESI